MVFASLAAFATAQNTQVIDGIPTVVPLYSSTIQPPVTITSTVTETTGTVTHTCIHTVDEFMPMTATVIQKQYVTSTFFERNTNTETITNTHKTAVAPVLVCRTETENADGGIATATDVLTDNKVVTQTRAETSTITHRLDDIVYTTTTAWLEQTQTYSKMIVRTEISHVFVTSTVYKTVTDTRIINPATRHATRAAAPQPFVQPAFVQPPSEQPLGGY